MARAFSANTHKINFGAVAKPTSDISGYAWVYPHNNNSSNNEEFIFSLADQGDQIPTCFYFVLNNYTASSPNRVVLWTRTSGGTWIEYSGGSGSAYTINTWQHVAFTRSSSAVKIYLNGVETANISHSDSLDTSGSPTFQIGSYGDFVDVLFNGRIANVGYHRGILTLEEIQHAYRRGFFFGKTPTLLAPLWGHSPEPDLSGNGYTGTVTGTAVGDHAPVGYPFPVQVSVPISVSGAAAYSLSIDPASVALTPVNVTLLAHYLLSMTPQSTALSSVDATLLAHRLLSMDPAIVTAGAVNVTLLKHSLLSIDPASVALTPVDVTLTYTPAGGAFEISIDPATVALTPVNPTLLKHSVLSVDPASLAATPVNVTFLRGYKLSVDAAVVNLSPVDVTPLKHSVLPIDPTATALTPVDVTINRGYRLSIDPAAVTLTPIDVTFRGGFVLPVDPATVTLSPVDVTIGPTTILPIESPPAPAQSYGGLTGRRGWVRDDRLTRRTPIKQAVTLAPQETDEEAVLRALLPVLLADT